jgi:hypothetical protein
MSTSSPSIKSRELVWKRALPCSHEPKIVPGQIDDSTELIVRLESAKSGHKIFDLAGRRGFPGLEVTLNAQSGEEGQHHLRNSGRSHPGLFRLDIHGEKALQLRSILRHGVISLIRKDSELPHGTHGKTSLLFSLIERTILEKALDVVPTERLLREKTPLPLALKIVPKARHKKIFLVSELRI